MLIGMWTANVKLVKFQLGTEILLAVELEIMCCILAQKLPTFCPSYETFQKTEIEDSGQRKFQDSPKFRCGIGTAGWF